MTTASGASDGATRPYRFGYVILDANLTGVEDPGASKVYFEFCDSSASYVFHEAPDQAKRTLPSRDRALSSPLFDGASLYSTDRRAQKEALRHEPLKSPLGLL